MPDGPSGLGMTAREIVMEPAYKLNPGEAPPAGTAVAGGSSPDFWDIGAGETMSRGMAPDHEFSELVEIETPGSKSSTAVWLLAGLLLIIGGYFSYEMFMNDRDPMMVIDEWMGLAEGDAVVEEPAPKPRAKKVATEPAPQTKKSAAQVTGNPYWTLPNQIVGIKPRLGRMWNALEEEAWRAGLLHRYPYQRYKTVQDVRKRRLRGSDAVLWDAMQDKKFWTRMFAAVGLAEMNIEVSIQTLEGAMAGGRSELVADFFERFTRRPNAGQVFVMRQVVRVLDEKGRFMVLRGINRANDGLRDLYLVAATQDPSRKIQRWAERELDRRRMPQARRDELLAVVEGRDDGNAVVENARRNAPAVSRSSNRLSIATEEEMEKELEAFEKASDEVEFYDTEGANVSETPDPETFEYTE
jgi:hypothetical protein